MSKTIHIEIPDKITENYPSIDELKKSIFVDIVISEYLRGNLTIRESASLLQVTYEGFIELLGQRNISFITANNEELEKSYQYFESFIKTYHGT